MECKHNIKRGLCNDCFPYDNKNFMNKVTLIIKWHEGRHERKTETELPMDKSWDELQEHIRLLVKGAIRYNTEIPVPKGLLDNGEVI